MTDIRGKVERVRDNRVEGWAFAEGGDPVSVALYIDGARVAKVRAKAFRKDLAKAGIGDGNCGFAFVIPPEHMDGRPHKVSVKAGDAPGFLNKAPLIAVLGSLPMGDDDDDVLASATHRTEAPEPEPELEPGASAASMPVAIVMPKKLRGRLEGLKKNRVVGWIYNTTKPDPVKLALFIDGVHVASQTARAPRGDLKAKGINDGLHGYNFDIPSEFHDGQVHVAEVRLANQPTSNLFPPLDVTVHASVVPADAAMIAPQAILPAIDTQVEFGEGIELIPDGDLDFTAEAEPVTESGLETEPEPEPEPSPAPEPELGAEPEPVVISDASATEASPRRQDIVSRPINLSRPPRNPKPRRR